jgi:tight adherence protein B
MMLPLLMFLIGSGTVLGAYAAVTYLPDFLARRQLDKRLSDISTPFSLGDGDESSIVKQKEEGPLPAVERLVARTNAGSGLKKLIDQSGIKTTPGSVVTMSAGMAFALGAIIYLIAPQKILAIPAALIGATLPFLFLVQRRSARLRRFEEQFPEALDLISRALRAGHAFQTTLGMIGDEVDEPVGPEFKKTFDQQNFGLPLKDALFQLSDRVPLLDVRFFVTAVLIQRETGGNLSEILDNLGHVVRERFKIRRQVRVHTAHGRFTAFVLLALPFALAVALTFLNPDHMRLLFTESMGRMMLLIAMVMQFVGFVWIRKVIKIEV